MKEFFVGLLVLVSLLILSVIAMLFMPLILVLSVFLQWLVYLAFVIFAIWLVGRVTLWGINRSKKGKVEVMGAGIPTEDRKIKFDHPRN